MKVTLTTEEIEHYISEKYSVEMTIFDKEIAVNELLKDRLEAIVLYAENQYIEALATLNAVLSALGCYVEEPDEIETEDEKWRRETQELLDNADELAHAREMQEQDMAEALYEELHHYNG